MSQMQEIFDKIVTHLRTQNEKSVDDGGYSCVYLSPNGLKCAVGCLISKDAYDAKIEGQTACNSHVKKALELSGIGVDEQLELMLIKMQYLHDDNTPDHWEEEFFKIAAQFDLKLKPKGE